MKSFSSEDEIRRYASALRASYERRAQMKNSPERLDAWFVKGLDGLSDQFLSLTNEGQVSRVTERDLGFLIRTIEETIKDPRPPLEVSTEDPLSDVARTLGNFLLRRLHSHSMGGMDTLARESLKKYLERFKLAQERIKGVLPKE